MSSATALSDEQIASVIPLSRTSRTARIGRGNIVGIATSRRPQGGSGRAVPWARWPSGARAAEPDARPDGPYWTDAGFLLALERFGYDVTDPQKAVIAFQRRFRPDLIDGIIDGECRAKLLALLLPRPQ
jgi:N-acetylmuramoyl-L-alanine amidase